MQQQFVYSVLSILQSQLVARNMDQSITHKAVVKLSEVSDHGHYHGNEDVTLSASRVQKVSSYFSLRRKSMC